MDPTRWPLARSFPRPHAAMKALIGLLMTTTLVIGSGCAKQDWIERTLVTESVAGVWAGSMVSPDGQPSVNSQVRLELQQQGPRVIGFYLGGLSVTVGRSTPIEGSVTGDVLRFKDARGLLTGELTVNGDEMGGEGTVGNSRKVRFDLRRVDTSPPLTSPPR